MKLMLWIGASGALGALARYGISLAAVRLLGKNFPYGTLLVNVLGCLLLGFLIQLGLGNFGMPKTVKLAATVGFLGAFTTFSTFGYETVHYMEQGQYIPATINVLANLIFGFIAVGIGLYAGKMVIGS